MRYRVTQAIYRVPRTLNGRVARAAPSNQGAALFTFGECMKQRKRKHAIGTAMRRAMWAWHLRSAQRALKRSTFANHSDAILALMASETVTAYYGARGAGKAWNHLDGTPTHRHPTHKPVEQSYRAPKPKAWVVVFDEIADYSPAAFQALGHARQPRDPPEFPLPPHTPKPSGAL